MACEPIAAATGGHHEQPAHAPVRSIHSILLVSVGRPSLGPSSGRLSASGRAVLDGRAYVLPSGQPSFQRCAGFGVVESGMALTWAACCCRASRRSARCCSWSMISGQHDDRARDDQLQEGRDAHQCQAVVEDADDEGADDRAQDRAATSRQRGPAQHDGGDGIELEVLPVAGCAATSCEAMISPTVAAQNRLIM